ncbi:hypothetical protein ASF39_19905 [Methylobacterium sp. Leaf108]|nr:hypothetical protein ASF39_19905 [Methylobacterium sp. Leaf108]
MDVEGARFKVAVKKASDYLAKATAASFVAAFHIVGKAGADHEITAAAAIGFATCAEAQHHVVAITAIKAIGAKVQSDNDVIATAAVERIAFRSERQQSDHEVVAIVAACNVVLERDDVGKGIVAGAALLESVLTSANEKVVAVSAPLGTVLPTTQDDIVACATLLEILRSTSDDGVVSITAILFVVAPAANDEVVTIAT